MRAINATGSAFDNKTPETVARAATLSSLYRFGIMSRAFVISEYQRLKRIAAIAMSKLEAESRSLIIFMDSLEFETLHKADCKMKVVFQMSIHYPFSLLLLKDCHQCQLKLYSIHSQHFGYL